ncbi:MAG: GNAT family N-acetyltransferase [Nibricoccus sp.]
MNKSPCAIREATAADLGVINDIYNHYVLNSVCTYQEVPESLDDRRKWFEQHGGNYPVTVACIDGRIVGWGSLSKFHARSAYRFTVENSVYVHHQHQAQGIGTAILGDLVARAKALGHHTIIAGIDSEQAGSIALHSKFGFQKVAHLKQVGFKCDRWLDVVYMELLF